VALRSGADDAGSALFVPWKRAGSLTVIGPSAAGAWAVPPEELERLIRDAGYSPVRRNGLYDAAELNGGALPILQRRTRPGRD
ncbi:MAG: hypothetical protein LC772_13315, partial [Chloroflexi bacterium]|nr:hypothetical protein [Chloroflexota bacterium]